MRLSLRTGLALALALCSAQLLSACDAWPLYKHLDPVLPPVRVAVTINLLEDTTSGPGEVQELAAVPYPSLISINGTAGACGFDPESEQMQWPQHPSGGTTGEALQGQGWYSGDVDYYSLGLTERGWLSIALEWDNAPPGEGNAPYRPDDEDGAWATESDLDFLVFTAESFAQDTIVNDDGFSLSFPEVLEHALVVDPTMRVIVAVACHHGLPSAYTLTLDLSSP
jgi:hypothetical protein